MVMFDLGTSPELRFFVGDGERFDGDLVFLLGDGERVERVERCLVGDGERSCLVGDERRLVGDGERFALDVWMDCGCCP